MIFLKVGEIINCSFFVVDTKNSFNNSCHDSLSPSRSNGQEIKSNKPENLDNVNDGSNNLPELLIVDQQIINAPNVNLSINDNHPHEQNAGNGQIQIYVITNPARVSKINWIVSKYKNCATFACKIFKPILPLQDL